MGTLRTIRVSSVIRSASKVAVILTSRSAVVRLTICSSSSSVRVVHEDVEHENGPAGLPAVDKVPFLLDGVLRGEHEERHRQLMPLAADRDLLLLHGFEQGGLGFSAASG